MAKAFSVIDLTFDHIGIVVHTLAEGREHLRKLLGVGRWTNEFADIVNGVYVQFGLDASGTCYEAIAPLGPDSPVTTALRRSSRILNHVAYLVPDLQTARAHLCEGDCVPAGEAKPAIAYEGRMIQFFMTPLGFLVEAIEAPQHRHTFCS
jgi:methylmalonyl-CoA/ethylmalonyl-CoA epimerase